MTPNDSPIPVQSPLLVVDDTPDNIGALTDLGLSVSCSVANQHGGHIDVRSEPDESSDFGVWLPAKRS